MASILSTEAVRNVLARAYADAAERDFEAKRALPSGVELEPRARADFLKDAPLAITQEVGELLHALALARRPQLIVEFGTSLGASTIYLAAAIHDCGGTGSLVTTEIQPDKARVAGENLSDAGLRNVADIRVGDALDTLQYLPAAVDVLFLDGWNDLYLPILELVEPQLASHALVIADYSKDDPSLIPYQRYVRDRAGGYFSVMLPLDDGVEISVRLG
jgi:predicted O-methyltransferase YrrM